MNGTEIPAAYSLHKEGTRHGLTLSLMGLGLFLALGATGLLLQRFADSGPEGESESRVAGLADFEVGVREGVVLSWTAPRTLPEWAEGSTGEFERKDPAATPGNPLVLVSGGLTEFEAAEDGEQSLLLEPDGTLRTESAGTLVGFLQGGGSHERGDHLHGPGQVEFRLLHQDAWLADRARVPVVEPDDAGGWIVRSHRTFEIGVAREPKKKRQVGPGRPRLHPRTGLPQVELASQRDW